MHDWQQIQQDMMYPEQKGGMDSRLPLSALLSQVLVAFTIEFDNEFEHQMPHRTTWGPAAHSRSGPWLVSLVMWSNFMQFVGEDGVPLRELEGLARITNLKGLERWGYVVVEPDPADSRAKPPRSDWVVRLRFRFVLYFVEDTEYVYCGSQGTYTPSLRGGFQSGGYVRHR